MYQQDWMAKWAIYRPHKTAVKEQGTGRSLTYLELNRCANRTACFLINNFKIKKGDRIAILAENCLEYIVLFSAAQKTGAVLVPLNYRLAPAEIEYLIADAKPKLLVYENMFLGKIKGVLQKENGLKKWTIKELNKLCKKPFGTKDGFFEINPVEENDPIFILYTSGTTGFPKGAIYSHKMLFWNSINTAMSLVINTESRTVNCMPPFHTGGWNVLTTPFLHHGGYICLMKNFDPKTVLVLLQKEKASMFMGVPTMLKMMADEPGFAEADLSHLYYMIVGGEPMPIPLIEIWHRKNVPVRQGYGMTEVGPNLTSLHQDDAIRKKGSIGRPNFYVEIKIIDKNGNKVTGGEAGELLLKGPMVTPGYWQNKPATEKAFSDGWFHTGDMVRQDGEGYLYVVDRIKNMFISGGENIYPAEIERVILGHGAVSEVAVVGVPHEKWGEVGKAYIVKKTNAGLNKNDLMDFCKSKLAKFKVPKFFVFINKLPKNDMGKIDREALKNWA
ncbi:MAG TPA: long-chain fatty acid--CoA ligase [Bacteroidetes bacterium]|nr:long-chain fatty acid--CoA ligase [Bacteroidota bacterium]